MMHIEINDQFSTTQIWYIFDVATTKISNIVGQSNVSTDVKSDNAERKIRCREMGLTPTLHASIHAKNQYMTLLGPACNTRVEVYRWIGDYRVYSDGKTHTYFARKGPGQIDFPSTGCELDVSKPSPQLIQLLHSMPSIFEELSSRMTRVCLEMRWIKIEDFPPQHSSLCLSFICHSRIILAY